MATVDDRVVQLQFDNKQFESATATSMATLDKLNKSLDFSGSKKGIDELGNSVSKFNLGNIGTTIEGVNTKFLAMATIGITALTSIVNKAIAVGSQITKSLTLDPVMAGFKNYELQINAIQTIMANTGLVGEKGLGVVEKTLADLNEYANLTIYDFSQMTQNIGRFTAAGVAIKPATDAIKGMSNVAALTGANTEQLGSAMYQMSQALSTGTIRLMDWNSLANANMGTQNMQMALKATAKTLGDHGKAMDNAIKKQGNFRDSLTEGWLTTDVFTKAMGVMAGTIDKTTGRYRAFTVEELKAKGYTEENAKALTKLSQAAIDSAINIRTFSQMMEALREGVATAWSAVFKTLFGSIFDATKLFTSLYNVLYDFFTAPIYKLNEFLKGFVKLGGMKVVIDAVGNAFKALDSIITPIKEAFRQIFPPATAQQLYDLAVNIRDFFANMKIGTETADRLRRIFAGLFSIFDIVKQVVGGLIGVFFGLITMVNEGNGGFLELIARIGDFLVKIDQAIKNGGYLVGFFDNLETVLMRVMGFFSMIGDVILAVFDGKNEVINQTGDALGRIADRLSPFGGLLDILVGAWNRFLDVLQIFAPFLSTVIEKVREVFSQIPVIIQQSVQNGDYSAMLDTLNTAIFGGIALLFRKFLKSGGPDLSGGLIKSIVGSFDALTGTLKAMQQQIKAKIILEIAIAVGILVAAVAVLALIPSGKLLSALAGLAGVFAELALAMKVLDKIAASSGFLKLPFIAASLILMSTAILILTGAVAILASMDMGELAKGLGALAVILGVLDATTKPLAANSPKLIATSAALILLGTALTIIAGAMKILATMSWEELGKGMASIVGALTGISVAMNLMPGPVMLVTAAGLVLVADAIAILSGAMKVFATLSWEEIAKGLTSILGALAAIGLALNLMPGPMMVVTAAGLVLVAVALNGIAAAMKIMASMSWEEIGKGLVAIAGALAILAAGLYLMTGTLMGSAALVVAAGALMIMAPAMKILGSLSWEAIGKGLVTLAGAFAVIGLAGLLLTPVIPQIIGLAAAVALLGVGIALLGVGVLAFATAITMLVAVGSMGVVALTAILQTVIGVIPTVMTALELAIVAFADAIIAAAPKIVEAIVVVLVALMNAIIVLTPKLVKTLGVLLDAFLKLLVSYVPKLVVAGIDIVIGIINGITKKLPEIIAAGTNLIIKFIEGIGKASLDIIKAAGNTLIKFLEGLNKWIRENSHRLNQAGVDLIEGIIDGMIDGIGSLGGMVIRKFQSLGSSIIDGIKGVFNQNSPSKVFAEISRFNMLGLAKGMDDNTKVVDLASRRVGKTAITAIKDSMAGISDAVSTDIDIQPTIAPVLDLTQFRKEAASMNGLLEPKVVQPSVSADTATATNTALEATKAAIEALTAEQTPSTVIELTQNNNSPKALSSAEIYRQTKNQLSTLKEALSS